MNNNSEQKNVSANMLAVNFANIVAFMLATFFSLIIITVICYAITSWFGQLPRVHVGVAFIVIASTFVIFFKLPQMVYLRFLKSYIHNNYEKLSFSPSNDIMIGEILRGCMFDTTETLFRTSGNFKSTNYKFFGLYTSWLDENEDGKKRERERFNSVMLICDMDSKNNQDMLFSPRSMNLSDYTIYTNKVKYNDLNKELSNLYNLWIDKNETPLTINNELHDLLLYTHKAMLHYLDAEEYFISVTRNKIYLLLFTNKKAFKSQFITTRQKMIEDYSIISCMYSIGNFNGNKN